MADILAHPSSGRVRSRHDAMGNAAGRLDTVAHSGWSPVKSISVG
jgi:hypothetical protein